MFRAHPVQRRQHPGRLACVTNLRCHVVEEQIHVYRMVILETDNTGLIESADLLRYCCAISRTFLLAIAVEWGKTQARRAPEAPPITVPSGIQEHSS